MYLRAESLRLLAGTTLSPETVQEILAEVDREITVYIECRGGVPSVCDATVAAASAFGKALVLEHGLLTGTFEASVGDFSSGVNVTSAVLALRKTGQDSLDANLVGQASLQSPRRKYLAKVNGR